MAQTRASGVSAAWWFFLIVALLPLHLAAVGGGGLEPVWSAQPSPTSDLPSPPPTATLPVTTTPVLPPPWPTATSPGSTPVLPTPIATATSAQPSPTPASGVQVCPQIVRKVPASVIAAALANPAAISGYNRPLNPSRPAGPMNPLRSWLSIRVYAKPFHPLYNGLEFKAGCP